MATYEKDGYFGDDFLIEGGGSTIYNGSKFMLDPAWDVDTDARHFAFTDDDQTLDGDSQNGEHGDDPNQSVVVTDAQGNPIASGQVYSEGSFSFTAPDGTVIYADVLEINGHVVGVVTSAPIQPGVTYTVSSVMETTSSDQKAYTDIHDASYDPDDANYIKGGTGKDSLWGGALNDTIEAGGGADTVDGGTGDDVIYYGTGGATQADGDSVEGGDGNDLIDDVSGSSYVYDDTLSGGAGSDTIWAGGGDDYVDGGTEDDALYGEDGDDTILGGAGNDTLDGGAGSDLLEGGAGDDYITTGIGADTLVYGDGSGADTVSDFDMFDDGSGFTTDQLDVSELTDADGNPVNVWDVVVSDDGSGNAVLSFPNGESITLLGVAPSEVSSAQQLNAIGVPCFVAGTRIATPRGLRPVEAIRQGDLVMTRDGPPQPVLWAGFRIVAHEALQNAPELRPVEFRAGAFGNARALRLSGQHCLWMPEQGGRLARARHLAATRWGGARVMEGVREVRYHHLLLPRHALVQAEGIWVESFWPGPLALRALGAVQLAQLLRVAPRLSEVCWAGRAVDRVYGQRCAALLTQRQISHERCIKWSLIAREGAENGGFSGVFMLR